MDRAGLVKDIQHKVATIESQEVLKELQDMIDEAVLSNARDLQGELPIHVKKSIDKAKQQLDNGKGISHDKVMNEIRIRYPKI